MTAHEETLQSAYEYIKTLVPLRFPVLLVDRVLEWTPGEQIVAVKAFTANEVVFGSRVAGAGQICEPLMIESMVQVAGLTIPKRSGKYVYLAGLSGVEIHRHIQPGDLVTTTARKVWQRGSLFRVAAESKTGGEIVISGEITYVYLDAPDQQ